MSVLVDRLRTPADLVRRPHRAVLEVYERFGAVAPLGAGPWRYVFLLGPEANRFVLARSDLFRWREAMESLIVADGETALIVSDGADHQRRRRLVAPAFTHRRVAGYADVIRDHVDALIDRWRPGDVVDLQRQLRQVIRTSAIDVLFGPRLAAQQAELGALLDRTVRVIDRPPPFQQWQRLGTPAWRRAVAARAAVAGRVADEISRRRRGASDTGRDVLGALLAAQDDDGSRLTDVEIVDQVISMIAAGYDTTGAAASWACHALVSDPALARDAAADLDATGWRVVDGVVSETLRLRPPGFVIPRSVAVPFDLAGHHVRAGSLVIISPYVTHRLPEVWPDPLRFDPQRWNPAAPGYRRPAPHEYLPFGGGPHRCVGAAFATRQLTVVLEQLVARTRMDMVAVDTRPVGLSAMRPRHGPVVRLLTVT